MYEAPKARNEAHSASGVGVGLGGGIPLSTNLTYFRQNISNGVIWDTSDLVLSELGPNVINQKFRHETSYDFSLYNTNFGEEYGLRRCSVLIRPSEVFCFNTAFGGVLF